jgi:hypothetical protein
MGVLHMGMRKRGLFTASFLAAVALFVAFATSAFA